MDRKILFFDIDGTLVTRDHRVPDSAKDAIVRARDKGHLVFVNTGRIEAMLTQLRREVPLDGLLTGCGTQVILDGKNVFCHTLPEETKQAIIAAGDKYNIDVVPEGRTGAYYKPGKSRFPQVENVKVYLRATGGISETDFYGDYTIQKFCIQSDEKSDLKGFFTEFSPMFDIIDRRGGFYECIPKGFGKGRAIEKMLDYYGISGENAYAFGDTANDLPMFQACGCGIAMRRHDPVLDPYTTFVTKDPEDDGIAYAMEQMQII